MLLFSTVLPISDTLTPDSFIRLVKEWNDSSEYAENIIPDIHWNGESDVRFGNEDVWMRILEYKKKGILAVRYEKNAKDGRIWDSDYIVDFQKRKICIRLDRSFDEEAIITSRTFSTPHILTLLIRGGYIDADCGVKIMRDPLYVGAEDIPTMKEIFRGLKHCRLPVVYVSKTFAGKDPLDVSFLASRLKGAAHVMVAESAAIGRLFRKECSGRCEKDGDAGIYFLSGKRGRKRFSYRSFIGREEQYLDAVVRYVIEYGKMQAVDRLYTWQGVEQEILNERLHLQHEERLAAEQKCAQAMKERDSAKNEAEEVFQSFAEEIDTLQTQVEHYRRLSEATQQERDGLRARMHQADTLPLLYMGDETELYEGEIKDILLSVLVDACKNVPAGSRRADVIDDIIRKNGYQHLAEKLEKRIKELFRGYKTMNGAMRQELQAMDFTITEDGSHYKLTYHGDPRYMTVMAKSGSDWREGKNIAAQIIRDML